MAKSTCPLPKNYEEYLVKPVKVAGPFTTQNLLFIVAISAAGIASAISLFLIMKHLHRYTEPKQQRQIVRIIFTPVVFSVIPALSILDYSVAKYIEPLMDLYETFGLASLLLLYVEYVAPDEHTRLDYFAALENHRFKSVFRPSKGYKVIPGGSRRWFQKLYTIVFIYAVIDVLMTVIQLITEATEDYCAASWNPRYAHIWIFAVTNQFLGWAVTCIVVFYNRMKTEPEFAMHKPGLKLISFKVIIFINFVQSVIFSIINVHTDNRFTEYDLRQGCPYTLMAIEQIFFATFFHYAFRSREYHETMKVDMVSPRMGTVRAAANAFNPTDLLVGMLTSLKNLSLLFTRHAQQAKPPQRTFGDSTTHLEPMSQPLPEYLPNKPYGEQEVGITVTRPEGFASQDPYRYERVDCPPRASYARDASPTRSTDRYNMYEDGSARLNPRISASHHRDSSLDGTDARSVRQMV